MYDLGYDKAREMLLKNRKVLEKIVEQLLEFENLTGEVTAWLFYKVVMSIQQKFYEFSMIY